MSFDITKLNLDDLILNVTSKEYKSNLSMLPKYVVTSDRLMSNNSYSQVFKKITEALPTNITIYRSEFNCFRWFPLSVLLSFLNQRGSHQYNNILIAVVYADQSAISFDWKADNNVFGTINNNQVIISYPAGGLYSPSVEGELDRPAYVSLIDIHVQLHVVKKISKLSTPEYEIML